MLDFFGFLSEMGFIVCSTLALLFIPVFYMNAALYEPMWVMTVSENTIFFEKGDNDYIFWNEVSSLFGIIDEDPSPYFIPLVEQKSVPLPWNFELVPSVDWDISENTCFVRIKLPCYKIFGMWVNYPDKKAQLAAYHHAIHTIVSNFKYINLVEPSLTNFEYITPQPFPNILRIGIVFDITEKKIFS